MHRRARSISMRIAGWLAIGVLVPGSVAAAQARRPFPRGENRPAPRTGRDEAKEKRAPEPAEPEVYTAIVGGDVLTVSGGLLRQATVLVRGRRIHRVGRDVEIPKDATVIDATGKVVMPGLVAATARGIGLAGAGPGSRPDAKLADSLDPFALSVELAAASGITTCMLVPGGGGGGGFGGAQRPRGGSAIDGTAAILKLAFGDLSSMVMRDPAAVIVNYRSDSPATKFEVREALDKAKRRLAKVEEWDEAKRAGRTDVKEPPKDAQAELLGKVLRREIPLRLNAWEQADLVAAAELAREYRVRIIVEQAVEAWAATEALAGGDVSLVLTPRLKVRPDREKTAPSGSRLDAAAIVARAGIPFAVVPPSPSVGTGGIFGRDLMNLPFEAAFAMRGGLTEDHAIASITLGAARVLGIDDRVGSIDVGKDADLLVLAGHPLDYRTFVEKTLVGGKLVYDKEKSTLFRGVNAAR